MRLAMLMTHYRSPIDWTEKRLIDAHNKLYRWSWFVHEGLNVDTLTQEMWLTPPPPELIAGLENDLNFSEVSLEIDKFCSRGFSNSDNAIAVGRALFFLGFGDPIFLARRLNDQFRELEVKYQPEIDKLIADRAAAKIAKDFGKADGIRASLVEAGVEIKDVPGGVEWSLTPSFDAAKLAEAGNV
jgi:cysteinyl-tRNA synthetase